MVVGNLGMAGHDRTSGNLAVCLFETRCDADCGCHLLFCCSILVDHDLCGLAHPFFRSGGGGETEAFMRYLLPLGVIVAEAFGCVMIHRLIFHRVEELAGR